MQIKLQKRLNDNNLFFLVNNMDEKKYDDAFLFESYEKYPNLEKYFFRIMSEELKETFEVAKTYSPMKYKTTLLILHNICFDGDTIDIRSVNLISDIYFKIRYEELVNQIEAFRFKINYEAVEKYTKEVFSIKYNNLSIKSQQLFDKLCNEVNPSSKEELFKEVMYLCISLEYERAKKRCLAAENVSNELERILKEEETRFIPDED